VPRGADEIVAAVLGEYAARGVLQPVEAGPAARARVQAFRWFRDREFLLHIDARTRRLRLEGVLDNVPPRSALDRSLRDWLRGRHAASLPAHRRIDPARALATWRNRAGRMQIELDCVDGDWRYATRRLVHLVNELYLDLLARPAHHEWLVETFELDPDNPRWP
jgi:hypothetical protein